MEEGVLHVKLLNRPFAGGSNPKHRVDGGWLHNQAESLIVINPGALRKTPEDPMSLVPIKHSVGEVLVRENPLASDDVGATGLENKFPCPIAHQSPILLLHICMPIQIGKSSADRGRNGGRRCRGSRGDESEPTTWKPKTVFVLCDPRVRVHRWCHRYDRGWAVR
jgi:hypothetical protein